MIYIKYIRYKYDYLIIGLTHIVSHLSPTRVYAAMTRKKYILFQVNYYYIAKDGK